MRTFTHNLIQRLFPILLASVGSLPSARAAEPLHLEAALSLVEQITTSQAAGVLTDAQGVSINRYGGSWNSASDPSFIRFEDPEQGILPGNNTKCSPLVTHLFRSLYGWNWSDHPFYDPIEAKVKTSVSPQAYQYVALIQQGKGFAPIVSLDAALPGDILSWWVVGSSSSDHTMVLAHIDWETAKPYPTGYPKSNPALAGTTFVEVHVIDSSSDTHSFDSRWVQVDGVLQHIAGIGVGVIGLLVDGDLRVVGRTWSLPSYNYQTQTDKWVGSLNSRLKLRPAWDFAIGRLAVEP